MLHAFEMRLGKELAGVLATQENGKIQLNLVSYQGMQKNRLLFGWYAVEGGQMQPKTQAAAVFRIPGGNDALRLEGRLCTLPTQDGPGSLLVTRVSKANAQLRGWDTVTLV